MVIVLLACFSQEIEELPLVDKKVNYVTTELSVRDAQPYQKEIIIEEFQRYSEHFQSYFLPPAVILFQGNEEPWVPLAAGQLCIDQAAKNSKNNRELYQFASWCQKKAQFRREVIRIYQSYVLQPKSCEELCHCVDPSSELFTDPSCLLICQDLGAKEFCFQNKVCCETLQRGDE